MKKNWIYFLLGFVAIALVGAKQFYDNTLILGSGTASNKEIIFDKGNGATNPRIRWDETDDKLKATNDNSTTVDLLDAVTKSGTQTITGAKTFSSTISGSIDGNAATVTNGVYTTGNQTIGGTKTFSSTITGSITGNAGTVSNGVYTFTDQTIGGYKTFSQNLTAQGYIIAQSGIYTNTGANTLAPSATLQVYDVADFDQHELYLLSFGERSGTGMRGLYLIVINTGSPATIIPIYSNLATVYFDLQKIMIQNTGGGNANIVWNILKLR